MLDVNRSQAQTGRVVALRSETVICMTLTQNTVTRDPVFSRNTPTPRHVMPYPNFAVPAELNVPCNPSIVLENIIGHECHSLAPALREVCRHHALIVTSITTRTTEGLSALTFATVADECRAENTGGPDHGQCLIDLRKRCQPLMVHRYVE